MARSRQLVVVADDFGIGPETSCGILELAREGRVSATVLLSNSPYAAEAVAAWRKAGRPIELGWHPSLTLDRPVLPPDRVPSLVGPDGTFWPLPAFLRRVCLGRLRPAEIAAELRAQYDRFRELTGQVPTVVNSHQHVSVFPPVGRLLHALLAEQTPPPFVRRVREPLATLAWVPGARPKRLTLTALGRWQSRGLRRAGFPGCEWLIGITDPPCVADDAFLLRWLARVPGDRVELACHPGYHDPTLIGRDCRADDASLRRRPCELRLLRHADFADACQRFGFTLTPPSALAGPVPQAA